APASRSWRTHCAWRPKSWRKSDGGRATISTIRRRISIQSEQFRQACAIHGGLWGLFLAIVAVKLSRLPIPSRRLRLRLFRDMFVRRNPPGLNEQEAEQPLENYRSFNALFTRGVKTEYRPIR